MTDSTEQPEAEVSVALPGAYWAMILGLLDGRIQSHVKPAVQELTRLGKTPESLTPIERTILAGPVLAKAAIIDAMADAGHMTPKAKARAGTEAIFRIARSQS